MLQERCTHGEASNIDTLRSEFHAWTNDPVFVAGKCLLSILFRCQKYFDTLPWRASYRVQENASGHKHDKPSRKLNIPWCSLRRCAFEAHSSTGRGAIVFARGWNCASLSQYRSAIFYTVTIFHQLLRKRNLKRKKGCGERHYLGMCLSTSILDI